MITLPVLLRHKNDNDIYENISHLLAWSGLAWPAFMKNISALCISFRRLEEEVVEVVEVVEVEEVAIKNQPGKRELI